MLFTHVSNFVHKSPKMTKLFRRFREEIAPVWVKIVVVFGQSIFIKSLIYQLSSLVLEIFFEWVVILKFLILFCVWSIYVFSAPFLKKVFQQGTANHVRDKKNDKLFLINVSFALQILNVSLLSEYVTKSDTFRWISHFLVTYSFFFLTNWIKVTHSKVTDSSKVTHSKKR